MVDDLYRKRGRYLLPHMAYTQSMGEQEQKPQPEEDPEKLPLGKTFQIILVQTAVFAAVFVTIIWLVEDQPLIAALLGLAAIVYLIVKKKAG